MTHLQRVQLNENIKSAAQKGDERELQRLIIEATKIYQPGELSGLVAESYAEITAGNSNRAREMEGMFRKAMTGITGANSSNAQQVSQDFQNYLNSLKK